MSGVLYNDNVSGKPMTRRSQGGLCYKSGRTASTDIWLHDRTRKGRSNSKSASERESSQIKIINKMKSTEEQEEEVV